MTVDHDLVVPGVWWLRGTRGSNVYLLEATDGQLVIVDSGFADSAAGIIEALAAVAPGRRVSQILLTHAHPDHVGAAMELRKRLGATIAAGQADCVVGVTSRGHSQAVLAPPLRRRGMFGWKTNSQADAVVVDHPLDGEVEVAPGLLAIPTPGHTPGSYCYVATARSVAFVGDLVISHRDGLARPLPFTNSDDARYLTSMREFASRAPAIGCVGHGAPIVEEFGSQLAALAALPRRSLLSPALLASRIRKLRAFARDLSRTRT